jgi:ABC-2 type transport system permease protein
LVAFGLEAICMIAIGAIFFDTHIHNFFSLALALLLGAAAFTALGLALTTYIKSAEGSSAVVNAIYLPVSFLSGAFFSPHSFPAALKAIANALPLVYMIRLVRDIALHNQQIWNRPGDVAVIAAWGLAGAIIAARRFRWEPQEG